MAGRRGLLALASSCLFGALYGHIEYRYITPLRPLIDSRLEGLPHLFSQLYPYHYLIMFPLFALVDFLAIHALTSRLRISRVLLLCLLSAWFLTSVWIEDISWFAERVLWPRPGENMPGAWISCPLEWTCLGLPSLGPLPVWSALSAPICLLLWGWALSRLPERRPSVFNDGN